MIVFEFYKNYTSLTLPIIIKIQQLLIKWILAKIKAF